MPGPQVDIDPMAAEDVFTPEELTRPPPVEIVGGVVLVGGFLDDVGNFFSHDVNNFVKDHQDLIAAGAGIAAGAIGGPATGAVAENIAKAGLAAAYHSDPATKAAAQQTVDAAHAAAQTDPNVGHAIAVANQATQQVAAGYMVAGKVQAAQKGDATAQAQLAAVNAKARAGDPSAQKAMAIAAQVPPAPAASALPLALGLGGLGALLLAIL